MEIVRMRAVFGRLCGEELRLHRGLNIMEAPNESGKSTWCTFIRAMLYGIDTTEREKGGVKPDKIKYAPWSGAPMEGEMDIIWNGQAITLSRSTKTANAPMRQFSAVYTGTAEPVPGLNGQNAGVTLLGVEKAVFERSAFIRQAGLGVSGNPELSKKIAAIVSTGEEDDSYADADARLRAWQRKRRYNKRGALPELEKSIQETEAALHSSAEDRARLMRLREELQGLETRQKQLTAQVEESRKRQRKQALESLSENKKALRQSQSAAERAALEERRCRELVAASRFAGLTPAEAAEKAAETAQRADALRKTAAEKASPLGWILALILAAAGLLCGALIHPALFFAGAACAAAAVWLLMQWKQKTAAAKQAEKDAAALLEPWDVSAPAELVPLAERYASVCAAWKQAYTAMQQAEKELHNLENAQGQLDAGLLSQLNFDDGDNEAARLGRSLKQTEYRMQEVRDEYTRLSGRLQAARDPLVLESAAAEMRDEAQELERQYAALELAIQTLAESNTEIQTRFSPALSKRATEYMSQLTKGSYAALTLDKDLAATARRTEDLTGRETAFLSAGTQDQLYLALRLAICGLALDENAAERCPLVLDDALVNFDPERTRAALELLRELAEQRQILLFSCRPLELPGEQ